MKEEPEDEQIDKFEKLRFVKGVFKNLGFIATKLDFKLVMVSNQDGLGTEAFPEETFWPVQNFVLQTLEGEGVHFDDIKIDPHFPEDNHPNRKPGTGMLTEYIGNEEYDLNYSWRRYDVGQDSGNSLCWGTHGRGAQDDEGN